MSARELIDEKVKEYFHHGISLDDLYSGEVIYPFVRAKGLAILPTLQEYIIAYDPKTASRCEEASLFIAVGEASGFDRGLIRLRGKRDGQSVIEALERAIERMAAAGFDKAGHRKNSNIDFYRVQLRSQKGVNERDELIRDGLRERHGIQMSDTRLAEFSNFLVSLDPTYPTWSDLAKDARQPSLKDTNRFYEAYLLFSAKK